MKRRGLLGGMIAVVLAVMMALALGTGSVSAEEPTIIASGYCGKDGSNVTWKLDSAGLLTINGKGKMKDYEHTYYATSKTYITSAPWGNQIKSVSIQNGVTSIGNGAFSGCTGLTSVTIPNGVTSIGHAAFSGCTRLTSVTIPDSVTSIGGAAFSGCTGLTSVTIPNGVTSIEGGAFSDCTGLTEILYNAKAAADLNPYSSNVFSNAGISSGGLRVVIGDGVKKIPDYLFSNCTGLTSVTIPNGVTSIGEDAFLSCTNLTSVKIPDSVASIGEDAFYGCTGLTSVTIGNGVTSIGGGAFYGCTGLTSVPIPDSVTNIGSWAFGDCTGLTSVTIPDSVTSIGNDAFKNCTGLTEIYYNAKAADLGDNCRFSNAGTSSDGLRAVIGDSVEHIPAYLFRHCNSLTSVTIGVGVTSIGAYAFSGCTGLTEIIYNAKDAADLKGDSAYGFQDAGTSSGGFQVVIGDSVERIPAHLFWYCNSLTSVTIGSGVTSIGEWAFDNCNNIEKVHISDIAAWCGIVCEGYFSNPLRYAHNLYVNDVLVTDLTIPDSVTSIGSNAFFGCTSLTSVTIPDSVTSIGHGAFYDCTGLTEVYYNAKSVKEESFAFNDAGTSSGGLRAVIGDSVELIPAGLFSGCTGLTSVTIPDSVTSIGDYAFSGCTGLKSVTIPNNVTSIGKEAFNCTGLTEVIYNAKAVADLNSGSYVFKYAGASSGGFRVVIGDSVERIPSYLFYNCAGLTEIYYNAKAATDLKESSAAFWYVGSSSGSVKVFIGEKVKKIPAYLFTGASNIRTFEFAGDPPEVGYAALLSNRTGARYAYYPVHNSAWTESARMACGSYLTWIGYCYEPISTGVCKANKAAYMVGDTLDVNGFSMTVTHEDGCVETISYNSGRLELGSYNMSTVGVKLIDVTYKDITAQLKICVYERKTEVMDKAGYPESSHDYENNLDKTYTYEAKGAITLDVTFSPQTEVETNVDYLYVNGTKYTGTALAGKTITVNGDTLTIRLVSDKSDSAYGFSIDRIVKTYINAETVVPPTCTERGYTMYLASGTVGNYVDALGHSFGDDQICSVCAAKLESIYISALPAKTVYSVGNGSLNLTGGKLMLVCDSGETEVNLTAAMVSGFDNTVLGKQTLTVTVGGLTTTFEVEVVERAVTSVAVENGKLVKHYTDGTTEETPLKDGAISDFAISETGEKTLTLTSENACVAAYKTADGNYVALKAVANEDGSYSYVVPEEVTEVTVAVKGDLDGDGQVSAKEARQILKASAAADSLTGLQLLCADLDGDGVISAREARISLKASAGNAKIDW